MSALPPISVPSIASPWSAPAPARSSYNINSSYQSASPSASPPYSPDFSGQNSQSVGSGQALLSLSPVTTVEVLLICISGAVILHFITRYLYLRAHRQLAAESRQQQGASSSSPVNGSSRPPGTQLRNDVEMHTMKPTVLVVQPDEEVCCGVEEDAKGGPSDQQLSSSGHGSQRKPSSQI